MFPWRIVFVIALLKDVGMGPAGADDVDGARRLAIVYAMVMVTVARGDGDGDGIAGLVVQRQWL